MGRVYKALVRADRWTDIDSPAVRSKSSGAARAIVQEAAKTIARHPAVNTTHRDQSDAGINQSPEWHSAEILRETPAMPDARAADAKSIRSLDVRDLAMDGRLVTASDSAAFARYKVLATRLLGALGAVKAESLLITSADRAEGKTTIAANLSWVLAAMCGRSVLLMQGGTTAEGPSPFFGLNPESTGGDAVEQPEALHKSVVCLEPNHLNVLASRETEPAGRFADPANLARLLKKCNEEFDLVIVDGPSLLVSAEARVFAAAADATLLVARCGGTRAARLSAARKLIPKPRRLGIILNDSSLNLHRKHERMNGVL